MNRTASLILAALVLVAPLAARAVPDTVAFSARIADNGKPVTGTHNFTFKLFDADTAGTELWKWSATDTPSPLTVNDGVVSYPLGSENPIPAAVVFNGLPVFLEVTYDGTTLAPRISIQSVPYALNAGNVPRVAFASRGTSISLSGSCSNYLSASITVPGPGTIVVDGLARIEMYHAVSSFDYVYVYASNSASDCGGFNSAGIAYAVADPVGYREYNIPSRRAFSVPAAGTYTYYLNSSFPFAQTGSTAGALNGTLQVTYFAN